MTFFRSFVTYRNSLNFIITAIDFTKTYTFKLITFDFIEGFGASFGMFYQVQFGMIYLKLIGLLTKLLFTFDVPFRVESSLFL